MLNRWTGWMRLSPDFLIIGAQRGGTTSLYNYLCAHPSIASAAQKEVHFFDLFFDRGMPWYRAQFPWRLPRPPGKHGRIVTGEASPYYIFHPLAPERIARLLPGVKLIVLLRNPIDRAYSHYNHAVRSGMETLSFEAALNCEEERLAGEQERIQRTGEYSLAHQWFSYRVRGCYAEQLETWFKLWPRDRFLIEASEAFYEDPGRVVRQVLAFLNLPAWEAQEYARFNEGNYPSLDPSTRRMLQDYYAPHNRRLYQLLGRDFGWD